MDEGVCDGGSDDCADDPEGYDFEYFKEFSGGVSYLVSDPEQGLFPDTRDSGGSLSVSVHQ